MSFEKKISGKMHQRSAVKSLFLSTLTHRSQEDKSADTHLSEEEQRAYYTTTTHTGGLDFESLWIQCWEEFFSF